MKFFIFKRLLQAAFTVICIFTIVFFVSRLGVNDPVLLMASPDATDEDIAFIRMSFGLDKNIFVQYLLALKEMLRGNFGYSFFWNRPVIDLILERLKATLILTTTSFTVGLVSHFPLGILAAAYRNTKIDKAIRVWVFFGQSMPGFWLALLCVMFFSVFLGWLPTSGYGDVKHIIMPGVVLALFGGAGSIRLLRSEMISVLSTDYIRMARAKGLSERIVLFKHALKVAILPLVTLMGGLFVALLNGSVVVELIFGWPGMGRLALQALQTGDFPIIQATVLFGSSLLIIGYLVVDIALCYLDPRIRFK